MNFRATFLLVYVYFEYYVYAKLSHSCKAVGCRVDAWIS